MIPAPFEYERATSVGHALELVEQGGEDARLLAGGHSLLPLMRLRLARPTLLVDIGRLDDLKYIRGEDGSIEIGALTTHHDLADSHELSEACPLLAHTAAQIGDPQVRHRGTIGGSVAHADPASDLPTALLALDAELIVEGSGGTRTVPASEFFHGPFMCDVGPTEMLTAIRIPAGGARGVYHKFNRRAQDWAIVGVAVAIETEQGAISSAAVALTNMAGTPIRAPAVEESLIGAADPGAIGAAAARVRDLPAPHDDEQASSVYRVHLAEVLIRRAVGAALA